MTTIKELIEKLNKIENKDQIIHVMIPNPEIDHNMNDFVLLTSREIEIIELPNKLLVLDDAHNGSTALYNDNMK